MQRAHARLEQEPLFQMCGIYQARIYQRFVVPSPTLSFNDGFCASRGWFLKEDGYACPLAKRCGAFGRNWDEELRKKAEGGDVTRPHL